MALDELSAERPRHSLNAPVAEVLLHATVTVVLLLAEFVEPAVDEGRNATLLSPRQCVVADRA
jgi:hypothetical protein